MVFDMKISSLVQIFIDIQNDQKKQLQLQIILAINLQNKSKKLIIQRFNQKKTEISKLIKKMIRSNSGASCQIFLQKQQSRRKEEAINWLIDFLKKRDYMMIKNYFMGLKRDCQNHFGMTSSRTPTDFADHQLKQCLSSLSIRNKDMLIRALKGKNNQLLNNSKRPVRVNSKATSLTTSQATASINNHNPFKNFQRVQIHHAQRMEQQRMIAQQRQIWDFLSFCPLSLKNTKTHL